MKETLKNTGTQNALLAVIAFLLSLNGYYIKTGNDRSRAFQEKSTETFISITKKLSELETWTHTIYLTEISQNTKRSITNTKEISEIRNRISYRKALKRPKQQ